MAAKVSWKFNDGGRESAGYKGSAGDCVARAIAIAMERDYKTVYDDLAKLNKASGRSKSARKGVAKSVYKSYIESHGWVWVPTMTIGSGCKVHLRADELPKGRVICRLSKHLCAVVDGVVQDTYDCSRKGTRCVYGYFVKAENAQ